MRQGPSADLRVLGAGPVDYVEMKSGAEKAPRSLVEYFHWRLNWRPCVLGKLDNKGQRVLQR